MSQNDNVEYDFAEDSESEEWDLSDELEDPQSEEEEKEKSRDEILIDAVREGDVETVRTMLSSVEAPGYKLISLLFTASTSASLTMVKLFVEEFGVHVTAFSEEVFEWQTPEPALNGASMRVGDDYQYAEDEDKDKKVAEGMAIVEYLISQGADVNFNRDCYSPIIHAVTYPPAVSLLISHGAKLNLTRSTATPVYYAFLKQSYESFKILLLHGSTIHPDIYSLIAQQIIHGQVWLRSYTHLINLLLLQQYIVDEDELQSILLDRLANPGYCYEDPGEIVTKGVAELKTRIEFYLNSRDEFVESYAYDPKYQLEWPKPHPELPFTSFSLFPPPFQRFLIFLIWCHRQSTCSFSSLLPELLWHNIVPFLNIYSIVCSFRRSGGEDDLTWSMVEARAVVEFVAYDSDCYGEEEEEDDEELL